MTKLVTPTARGCIPLLINGQQRIASKTFGVRSALTERKIYECSNASEADADDALSAAQNALGSWGRSKPAHRRDILLRAADLFHKRNLDLEDTIREEIGTNEGFAQFNTTSAVEMIRDAAGRLSQTLTGQIPSPIQYGQSALLHKVPYGVVLGIAPWNAPYLLGVRAALYPIAAGNTCVLKGSELSPRCFHHIGEIFQEAGLPAGVLNVLFTRREDSPEITNRLIHSPAIRKVNFTGSSMVGSLIAAEAAKALKPSLMELGGKASAIVMPDANIALAAQECAQGAFINSGQACMSTERIIVFRENFEAFREKFLEEVHNWKSGAGDASVLIQEAAVQRNQRLAKDAISKGGKLLAGSPDAVERIPASNDESGFRLKPTVLEGVDKTMNVYYEESFGPTVSLFSVDSENEAISLANDTEYGLSCSIFTEDLRNGFKLAQQMDTGAVHINSMSVHDEVALAHGGQKNSGWGRFNAEWGINEFLQPKVITYVD